MAADFHDQLNGLCLPEIHFVQKDLRAVWELIQSYFGLNFFYL